MPKTPEKRVFAFLNQSLALGVAPEELFDPPDLLYERNMVNKPTLVLRMLTLLCVCVSAGPSDLLSSSSCGHES